MKTEVAVIGGGPAGLCASIEAAKNGADVTLVDENNRAGGQLFKQIHRFFGSEKHLAGLRGFDIGNLLLDEAKKNGVRILLNTVVWGLFPDKKLGLLNRNRVTIIEAERIVVCTGAAENALSFTGWTLPNIMGAGAAQTMININRVLPGKRVLIIGSGNVGLIVAYQLLQAGAEVLAVVEARPSVRGYQVHASKIVRMGIPILTSHTIIKAEGDTCVRKATIARIIGDRPIEGSEIELDVDLICIAVGLRPLAELCWMAGMKFGYQPHLGGFVPLHDENLQSTVSNIYVAGDVAGVEEASTAMEEGKLAGIAVSVSLGRLDKRLGERLINEAKERLLALRLGPYGKERKEAKERIISNFRAARGKYDEGI
ncbi:MAG: NAD(P)/FAD-dependent oxidoreductase [Thermodesulfovibrionales bacterium]